MKICVAQTQPIKGDIAKNILRHKELINLALDQEASMIVFPELSITGYEPELAAALATEENDHRFDVFQVLSDANNISICFGFPAKNGSGVSISMAIFEPGQRVKTYSKKYLHSSEEPFFTSGIHFTGLIGPGQDIAPAICYEISVPQHAEDAAKKGASIYIASIVEDVEGVERAIHKLSAIAARYSMIVLIANCTGPTGAYACGGKSSAWNDKGELKGQLDAFQEGILVYDTETGKTIQHSLPSALVK